MTDEILALARENQRKTGVENVEFLKGEIEHIPPPGNPVDVIISNCVINLSGDKDQVLREASGCSNRAGDLRFGAAVRGTAFFLAGVVGSGIMAERLNPYRDKLSIE
jgi:hypothetical protein